jgi:hypothetical protein
MPSSKTSDFKTAMFSVLAESGTIVTCNAKKNIRLGWFAVNES